MRLFIYVLSLMLFLNINNYTCDLNKNKDNCGLFDVSSSEVSNEEILNDSSAKEDSIMSIDIGHSIYQIDSRWIGSGYGATYYFDDSGWYCYLASDYGLREEQEIVSQRGQWTLNEETIVLMIKEQVIAEGGQMEWGPISGNTLNNYTGYHFNIDKKIEYDIAIQYDQIGYYLAMGSMSLYPSIQVNEAVKVFAKGGYDAYANLPVDQKKIWQLNLPMDEYKCT